MSDAANVEVTLTVQNNTEVELGDVTDGYAADQARAYRDKAGEYAADALNSKNMAEAWRKATVPRPAPGPTPVRPGVRYPRSGRKAPPIRMASPEPVPPRPGLKRPEPGQKVRGNRTEFPEPSLPRAGPRFLPKKRQKPQPVPKRQIPVLRLLVAVRLKRRPLNRKRQPRLPWRNKVPTVRQKNWPRCRST